MTATEDYHAHIGRLCPHAKRLLGEDYRCGNLLGCASCRRTFEEDLVMRDTRGLCMGRFDSSSRTCLEFCPRRIMEECVRRSGMPYTVQRRDGALRVELRLVILAEKREEELNGTAPEGM
jgi:hypothetical protein